MTYELPDIYFEDDYGIVNEVIEGGESISYIYESEIGKVKNLFIKRKIDKKIYGKTYYDITTPYGYGGPIILECGMGMENELVKEYKDSFKRYCIKNNIVSEFVRFHPIEENHKDFITIYNVSYLRNTVGTDLYSYENPFQKEFSKSCRKSIRRSLRDGVEYEIIEKPNNLEKFKKVYKLTMDRNNADDFYYFDDIYFDNMLKSLGENIINVNAIYKNKVISSGLYFTYGDFIHMHLSGTLSEYLNLSPAYILKYAITEWGKKNNYKYIHHGGGISNSEEDSLYKFKQKFGKNTEFKFYIGKKIWNSEVYNKLCEYNNTDSIDIEFFPKYRYEGVIK